VQIEQHKLARPSCHPLITPVMTTALRPPACSAGCRPARDAPGNPHVNQRVALQALMTISCLPIFHHSLGRPGKSLPINTEAVSLSRYSFEQNTSNNRNRPAQNHQSAFQRFSVPGSLYLALRERQNVAFVTRPSKTPKVMNSRQPDLQRHKLNIVRRMAQRSSPEGSPMARIDHG